MSALFDKVFLDDIGVTLNDAELAALSDHYEETLSRRVINEIVAELDEPQLEQLHEYKAKSEDELWQWLKDNVPQLGEIVQDEVAILLGEIAENSQNL